MQETFAKPAVSAIIEKIKNGETYILVQQRQKKENDGTNGLLEVAGGKIREYENVFDALRREVYEETGLKVTQICGEENRVQKKVGSVNTINFSPLCVTQNSNGIYSIIMLTFVCRVEGEPKDYTDEAAGIRWAKPIEIENIINDSPETIFPMDVLPLLKYIQLRKEG